MLRPIPQVLLLVLLGGCVLQHGQRHAKLVPAPVLEGSAVRPDRCTPEMSLLYVTDRRDLRAARPERTYGYERGVAVRVGTARVSIDGHNAEAIYERTATTGRREPWRWRVDGIHEHGTLGDGSLATQLRSQLADADSREVLLTIHGVGAGFADSLYDLAQIWHHMGRPGVPVAYSWPSGKGGFIQNVYQYDRDSGYFTIPHLKRVLRLLGELPEVERVHIVAHSRGTAIVIDALRELRLELLAEGPGPEALKIQTLLMAAPDFDIGLFEQRILDEGVLETAERTVMYISDRDMKLMAAGWMHGGPRVGGAKPDEVAHLSEGRDDLELFDASVFPRGGRHDHHLTDPNVFGHMLEVLQRGSAEGEAAEAPVSDTLEGEG